MSAYGDGGGYGGGYGGYGGYGSYGSYGSYGAYGSAGGDDAYGGYIEVGMKEVAPGEYLADEIVVTAPGPAELFAKDELQTMMDTAQFIVAVADPEVAAEEIVADVLSIIVDAVKDYADAPTGPDSYTVTP